MQGADSSKAPPPSDVSDGELLNTPDLRIRLQQSIALLRIWEQAREDPLQWDRSMFQEATAKHLATSHPLGMVEGSPRLRASLVRANRERETTA